MQSFQYVILITLKPFKICNPFGSNKLNSMQIMIKIFSVLQISVMILNNNFLLDINSSLSKMVQSIGRLVLRLDKMYIKVLNILSNKGILQIAKKMMKIYPKQVGNTYGMDLKQTKNRTQGKKCCGK